jgi:hypothetical protein
MVMAGLLWYDDDAKRPLAAKIIEATERYRDRIGFAPTVCQLPPQQLKALTEATASHRKRARTPVIELPRKLRLEPDERLHPNTFLLGMGEDDIAIPNPLLAEDDAQPRRARQIKHPRKAKEQSKAAAPATPPVAPAKIRAGATKATPLVKPDLTTDPALKPKVAVAAKSVAAKSVAAQKVAEPVTAARPATSAVKRSVTAKQAQSVEAKQATLWDTTPAKATRARATSRPVAPSAEKGEKVQRTAKPARAKAEKVANATKAATPTRQSARRAAPSAAKPAMKATRPARTPAAKPAQHTQAAKPNKIAKAERRAKPAAFGSTKATGRVAEKAARPARPTANKRTRTVRSVEKQTTRATITPAAPAKPKATRKPTVEKSVTGARPTHAAPKPATPRRRLAQSA